jgi:acetolactate synthase-1/2/3 large subunit
VVALAGQVAANVIGRDAFQEADTIGISLPFTKCSFQVRSAAAVPAVIHEAFKTAVSGRPGPVLVDLPKSVLVEQAEPSYPASPGIEQPERVREWRDEDMERAVEMILESRRAVLYVGGGVIASAAWRELLELAELACIPVTTTLMGLGALPSLHPLSLGMLGMHGSYATNQAISHCDLLVAIGARFDDRVTGRISGFAPEAKKIHIDVDPSEISKNVRVDLGLVGDAREALQALLAELKRKAQEGRVAAHPGRQQWLQRIETWRAEHPLTYDKYGHSVKPQYVVETLSLRRRRRHLRRGRGPEPDVDRPILGLHRSPHLALLGRPGFNGLRFPGSYGRATGFP